MSYTIFSYRTAAKCAMCVKEAIISDEHDSDKNEKKRQQPPILKQIQKKNKKKIERLL
ncbi:MAG TPA: hypothetical protein VE076_11060 [Nitrososphaeraceae archaeon]|nr:hypothetical protein [Nitrososphaeraceae archaeon]